MKSIYKKYALDHGLKFSTDSNPIKSKTKCLAFLQTNREIKPVKLCGNDLPWVSSCTHLGNTVTSTKGKDIRSQDVKNKRASFINRTNEILQEFYFAHPATRSKVINIQNTHFYGSVLWDLRSVEVTKLEKSWNVSVRRTFNLPWDTHCYLIEPFSNEPHIRTILAKRFVNFISAIRNSQKRTLRNLLKVVEFDTPSVTGRNLRNILLMTNVTDIRMLKPSDVKAKYCDIPSQEKYRVDVIREIVDIKDGQLNVPGFNTEELDLILKHVCSS